MDKPSGSDKNKRSDAGGIKTLGEREFIHSIATPLTVALMQTEQIVNMADIDEKTLNRAEKILDSLKKIEIELTRRRDALLLSGTHR